MQIYKKILIFTLIVTVCYYLVHSYTKGWELLFLPVGNGDSILLLHKNRPKILIDGGPDFYVDYFLSKYFIFNNCSLDYIFLTHPHADHLKGLTRVLEHCKVKKVFENRVDYNSKLYRSWQNLILEKSENSDSKYKNLEYRSSLTSDFVVSLGDLKLIVLHPSKSRVEEFSKSMKNANDVSLVLLLDFFNFEALLMGDLEVQNHKYIDLELMKKYVNGSVEVLKVPHHGAKNGNNPLFFDNFQFDLAVITTSPNKYGHPSNDTIKYFENKGTKVLRTDFNGLIKLPLN